MLRPYGFPMKHASLKLLHFIYTRWLAIVQPISLGVRILLVRDGQVLLVRHTYQDHWFLVGGGLKRHETLEQAARREAMEEAGAELGDLTLFGIYSNFFEGRSDNIAVFVCENFTYTGEHDREIAAVQFFPMDALPDDIAPGNKRRVEDYLSRAMPQNNFGIW